MIKRNYDLSGNSVKIQREALQFVL